MPSSCLVKDAMESIYSIVGVDVDPTLRYRKSESFGAHILDGHPQSYIAHTPRGGGVTPIDSIVTDTTGHSQSVVKADQKHH